MGGWYLNIWQRVVFAIGAVLCLIGAANAVEGDGEPLLPFLWGLLLLAVTVSPRAKAVDAEPAE